MLVVARAAYSCDTFSRLCSVQSWEHHTVCKHHSLGMQIPIGAEDRFEGMVDLVRMKGITWDGEVHQDL